MNGRKTCHTDCLNGTKQSVFCFVLFAFVEPSLSFSSKPPIRSENRQEPSGKLEMFRLGERSWYFMNDAMIRVVLVVIKIL